MRFWTFSRRSSIRNSVKLRKITAIFFFEKRHLFHSRQGRLWPISKIQGSYFNFRTFSRFFSHIGSDILLDLPRSCPGCGAFTQTTNPDQAGYYGEARKAVQAFIAWSRKVPTEQQEKDYKSAPGSTHRCLPTLSKNHQGQDYSRISLQVYICV